MYRTLRIDDSVVTWYLTESDAADLVDRLGSGSAPLVVPVQAPLRGELILSPAAATVAVMTEPPVHDWLPSHILVPAPHLYVPVAQGPTTAHPGYRLAGGTSLDEAKTALVAAMRDGTTARFEVTDQQTNGTLAVNGAQLAYAVLVAG